MTVVKGFPRDIKGEKIIYAPSLTVSLTALNRDFSVSLTSLGNRIINYHEALAAELSGFRFIREVTLNLAGCAVVRARSYCAAENIFWPAYLDCGEASLGVNLFKIKPLKRTPFYFFKVHSEHLLVKNYTDTDIWARQSVFGHYGNYLILTECFLPALVNFL